VPDFLLKRILKMDSENIDFIKILYDRVFEILENLGFKIKPRPQDDDVSIDPSVKELLSDD
jgi:hypothetical protein